MEAYAALLSLAHTIHQIQNHPRPPISLDTLQTNPLIEMVTYLLHFLENYAIDDADGLVGRMADAARKAEDIIESHIADHIEALGKAIISSNSGSLCRYMKKKIKKTSHYINNKCSHRNLQKMMHDLSSITKDVAAIKDKAGGKIASSFTEDDATLCSDDVLNDIMDKLNSRSDVGDDTMVGSDDVMYDVMDKLTGQQSSRRIVAIAGMGGIGKTTLAKSIYEHPLIVEYFDMCGWATISQEFDFKGILLQVLHCWKTKTIGIGGNFDQMSEHELGETVHKSLFGRRYLIVMDDIWVTDAWDKVKSFFPDNNNGSKVLITTRLLNVALQLDGSDYFQMSFLNPEKSWKLLRRCVFEEQGCPPELEEIGKEVARNCGGLPLSIVVIGGLLAKSEQTRENWQHVLENVSSIVNLEEGERCFRILKLSYNELPVHLKPCFLYMGMFPEDHRIHVPTLIKLWVDEGFVKPVAGKSLKTIARVKYLHDLVLRNLILVRAWGPTRRIKLCGIHDLMRDLCIKEAEKYKLFRTMETTTTHNPDHDQSWRALRRIGINQAREYIPRRLPDFVESASRVRTLICNVYGSLPSVVPFRMLRIMNGYDKLNGHDHKYTENESSLPVNLCHVVAPRIQFPVEVFNCLWNLQTLIVDLGHRRPVLDIWRMPQLRHVKVQVLWLTDPPPLPMDEAENGDRMVLEKLETLQYVCNLRLSEEVVERIPNINKLRITYDEEELSPADYGLDNLCRLHKLEALSCCIDFRKSEVMITFPVSLRKQTLWYTYLGWEEMGTKIGSLPYLEALQLWSDAFVGPEWETAEGGFPSLKYLKIWSCRNLENWRVEATHFPRLERLQLVGLHNLKEIPLGIGEITILREIIVEYGPDSAVLSAKKILEEQEGCYGEVELQITVRLNYQTQLRKESLRSRNLRFL